MPGFAPLLAVLAVFPVTQDASSHPQGPADLLVLGGRVLTLDPVRPEVAALAVRDGRILFLGSEAETRSLAGPGTWILDVGGGGCCPPSRTPTGIWPGWPPPFSRWT